MEWNADLYQNKHDFVAEYGRGLLSYVPDQPGQHILDLGCGTGTLTQALAHKGNRVLGIDSSPGMIQKARSLYPDLSFEVADACALPWCEEFDLVFSNAVFHWITTPRLLLENVWKVLKPGGKLVCEFGAKGNVGRILGAMEASLVRRGLAYQNPFYFPGEEEYRQLLAGEGFRVETLSLFDRPTPLKDGPDGLRNWVLQFFANELHALSPSDAESLLNEMDASLRGELWDGVQWVGDYRRLRLCAVKTEKEQARA